MKVAESLSPSNNKLFSYLQEAMQDSFFLFFAKTFEFCFLWQPTKTPLKPLHRAEFIVIEV